MAHVGKKVSRCVVQLSSCMLGMDVQQIFMSKTRILQQWKAASVGTVGITENFPPDSSTARSLTPSCSVPQHKCSSHSGTLRPGALCDFGEIWFNNFPLKFQQAIKQLLPMHFTILRMHLQISLKIQEHYFFLVKS